MGSFVPPCASNYMAKADCFEFPCSAADTRGGGVPVWTGKGSAKVAIKRSVEVLRGGGVIGIFPGHLKPRETPSPAREPRCFSSLTGAGGAGVHRGKRPGPAIRQIKVAFGPPLRLPEAGKQLHDDRSEVYR